MDFAKNVLNNIDEFYLDDEYINSASYKDIKQKVDVMKEHYLNKHKNNMLKVACKLGNDKRKNVQNLSESIIKFSDKYEKEFLRVRKMYEFDRQFGHYSCLVGVDEVGRGPLAGPIVAGAVVLDLNNLDDDDLILGIKDSKKLSLKKREELSEKIKKKALYYCVWEIDNAGIDNRGIAWCNNEVLKQAALNIKHEPDIVISDGYSIKTIGVKNEFVIKGDAKSASIACGSIIAKVCRDNIMKKYSQKYPEYDFYNNVGYGTKKHIEALKKYGPCKLHRRSFLNNIL